MLQSPRVLLLKTSIGGQSLRGRKPRVAAPVDYLESSKEGAQTKRPKIADCRAENFSSGAPSLSLLQSGAVTW
jgi:hypothetical protein